MKLDKFLCFMFLSVFLALILHKTPFFEKITNQILGLNYAQLICEHVRSENKRLCRVTVNSTSIATKWLSLLKVSKVSYPRLTMKKSIARSIYNRRTVSSSGWFCSQHPSYTIYRLHARENSFPDNAEESHYTRKRRG